jgi:hypothetical protein
MAELLNSLSTIRAKQVELVKAEQETIAAIRATLKRQKEDLAELERKLATLGISIETPPPPAIPVPRCSD